MIQTPVSPSDTSSRASGESKKRKSLTETEPGSRLLALERNTSSPITSDSSSTNISTPIDTVKAVRLSPLEPADSDITTEEDINTIKGSTSHISSVLGSPLPKADDGSPKASDHGSNKKARFSDDVHSPILARQRSYTFSTADEYRQQPLFSQNPLDALSWLASIAEKEVDAAKSLFELSHDSIHEMNREKGEEPEEKDDDDDEEEEENGDTFNEQYIDPYLTHTSSTKTGKIALASSGNDSEVSDSEFAAVSYLQSFQQKAKLWKSNPFTDAAPSLSAATSMGGSGTLDPLELLTNSADMVASPVTRRSFLESNDYHYLDTMNVDLQNVTHSAKVYSSGRARSASMSILESTSSSSAAAVVAAALQPFDNPALARLKESFGKKTVLPVVPPKGEGFIGIYSPEERKLRIQRFLEKRKHRMWAKKVKYDVRKNFADSRIRVKGRFVKKDEEKAVMILMQNK